MAIRYELSRRGDLLFAAVSGFDESLAEVQRYGFAVLEAATAAGCSRVLCDERELEYRLGTIDTYQLAEAIASVAPSIARVAIVCQPRFIEDVAFFEDVAVNRGLCLRAFRDLAAAEEWLGASGG